MVCVMVLIKLEQAAKMLVTVLSNSATKLEAFAPFIGLSRLYGSEAR
jgi:hypothetical protein